MAVKIGDRVTTGQRLGLLGNSGNTSAPHLHFHVMSGPSPLGSDGMPYVLERFSLLGAIDGALLDRALEGGALGTGTVEGTGEAPVMSEALPMNLDLVDFGAR